MQCSQVKGDREREREQGYNLISIRINFISTMIKA